MTKREQRALMNQMVTGLRKHLSGKLKDIPADWDGIELREWMADATREQYAMSHLFNRGRKRAYNHARLTRNL